MKYLYTPQGLLTHTPASSGFDRQEKGYYLFTAGARENGGIFFHSNTWAIIALALLGRAEEAFRCYAGSLPVRRNRQAERWMTEPYVYAQTMLAPPHERAGACVNSWLTGTASWMYVAATQYILGVRPDYEGLRIDPQVPDDWAGFRVERMCRQTHCRIEMRRSSGEDKGLFVQGQKCPDDLVPWSWLDGREQLDILLVR